MFNVVAEDEDVVQVDHTILPELVECGVYESLEETGSIRDTLGHVQEFKRALMCSECQLPFISGSNSEISKRVLQVHQTVVVETPCPINGLPEKGNGVAVSFGDAVDWPEIYHRPQGPVLFGDEQCIGR